MKELRKIKKWHCFFEQSGTFKEEFRKLGLEAEDYDILDEFGQTDHKADLFAEINAAFEGGASIFDDIKEDEAIIAFFPCVRFEVQALMLFKGQSTQLRNYSQSEKLRYSMRLHEELHDLYMNISKLALVCIERDIPLIIENPYKPHHYLARYWPIEPAIIEWNRRENGDFYEKPTQYFFIQCEPENNLIMDEPIANHKKRRVCNGEDKVGRSMISNDYARRFIRTYLTGETKPQVEEPKKFVVEQLKLF